MATASPATADALNELDDAGVPTEKPVRPPEPRKPRPLKDAEKNAERQVEYQRLHNAWEADHAIWLEANELWKRAQKQANRPAGDSARRVQQRRQQNPNIAPSDVVSFFLSLENRNIPSEDMEAGVEPPQCLLDFLDSGGSANAQVHWIVSTSPRRKGITLLQLCADKGAGPRIMKLLLERGADVNGSLSFESPVETVAKAWRPFTGHCNPVTYTAFDPATCTDWEDGDELTTSGISRCPETGALRERHGGCYCCHAEGDEGCAHAAEAQAREAEMRLLLSYGADKRSVSVSVWVNGCAIV